MAVTAWWSLVCCKRWWKDWWNVAAYTQAHFYFGCYVVLDIGFCDLSAYISLKKKESRLKHTSRNIVSCRLLLMEQTYPRLSRTMPLDQLIPFLTHFMTNDNFWWMKKPEYIVTIMAFGRAFCLERGEKLCQIWSMNIMKKFTTFKNSKPLESIICYHHDAATTITSNMQFPASKGHGQQILVFGSDRNQHLHCLLPLCLQEWEPQDCY